MKLECRPYFAETVFEFVSSVAYVRIVEAVDGGLDCNLTVAFLGTSITADVQTSGTAMLNAFETDCGMFAKNLGSYELSFLQMNDFRNRAFYMYNYDLYIETFTRISCSIAKKSDVMYR